MPWEVFCRALLVPTNFKTLLHAMIANKCSSKADSELCHEYCRESARWNLQRG